METEISASIKVNVWSLVTNVRERVASLELNPSTPSDAVITIEGTEFTEGSYTLTCPELSGVSFFGAAIATRSPSASISTVHPNSSAAASPFISPPTGLQSLLIYLYTRACPPLSAPPLPLSFNLPPTAK